MTIISSTATSTLISPPLPLAVSFPSRQLWLHRDSWNWNRPWWSHWGRCFRGWRNPKESRVSYFYQEFLTYIARIYLSWKIFSLLCWWKYFKKVKTTLFQYRVFFLSWKINKASNIPCKFVDFVHAVPCLEPFFQAGARRAKDVPCATPLELWRPTWVTWKVLVWWVEGTGRCVCMCIYIIICNYIYTCIYGLSEFPWVFWLPAYVLSRQKNRDTVTFCQDYLPTSAIQGSLSYATPSSSTKLAFVTSIHRITLQLSHVKAKSHHVRMIC